LEAQFSNYFIDAWHTVFGSFSGRQIMSADVKPPQETLVNGDILVLMGLMGDINGQICMSMNAETGKSLASEMLGGMEIASVDEMVTSAVGEMCNMVMGNVCTNISSINANVDITPPTVVAGPKKPRLTAKPSYEISFLLEGPEIIDFHIAVK
jgi:chemotaxis protein CheX